MLEALRGFWEKHHAAEPYRHLEIFLLRNLPRVGGSFVEPDSIRTLFSGSKTRKKGKHRFNSLNPMVCIMEDLRGIKTKSIP